MIEVYKVVMRKLAEVHEAKLGDKGLVAMHDNTRTYWQEVVSDRCVVIVTTSVVHDHLRRPSPQLLSVHMAKPLVCALLQIMVSRWTVEAANTLQCTQHIASLLWAPKHVV